MKNDDLLNKYIDNELSRDELDEVEELVKTNNKFRSHLSVHKYLHETLYQLPIKNAPLNITEIIMNKISGSINKKYKKNYLFRFVIAVLTSILVLTLFMFFYFLGDLELFKNASEISMNYSDKILPSISYMNEIFNSNVFKTVTGILGFVVLLLFYFNYNSHKQVKDMLTKL
jgi:hypothetical protein